jgi:hypothetical protein
VGEWGTRRPRQEEEEGAINQGAQHSQPSQHPPSATGVGTKRREKGDGNEIEVGEDDLVVLLKGKTGTGPPVDADQIVEALQRRLRAGQRNVYYFTA